MTHNVKTARPVTAAYGVFWTSPEGLIVPCEAYTIDADGKTTSGDGAPAELLAAAYKAGETFLIYSAHVTKAEAEREAAECEGGAYSARELPAGTFLYDRETLCVVAPVAHFRRDDESAAEYAERQERAEAAASEWFNDLAAPQIAIFNERMAVARAYRGAPKWDRVKAAADREFKRTTENASRVAAMVLADMMTAGEVSEATSYAFDELAVAGAMAEQPTANFLENILAPLDWSPRAQAAE